MSKLDNVCSIWVEPEELGKYKEIKQRKDNQFNPCCVFRTINLSRKGKQVPRLFHSNLLKPSKKKQYLPSVH